MKKQFRIRVKLLLFAATLLFLVNNQAKAQDEFDVLLEGGTADAEKYLGKFIEPVFKGVGFGLANGWYNTAKTHKVMGFDLTITANLAMIPDKDQTFRFANSDFERLQLEGGNAFADLPTVVGPKATEDQNIEVAVLDDNNLPTGTTISRQAPSGLDLKEEVGHNFVPVPMAHLGIGLPKDTDLKLRWAPTVDVDDFEGKIFGFGILHNIKQWIPGLKESPFHLSGFVGYTKIEASYDLTSSDLNNGTNDQISNYKIKSLTVQGIISKDLIAKKLFEFTLYGSLGFNSASSELQLLGTYELAQSVDTLNDPIDLSFSNSGVRGSAGLRMKLLAFLTLHADYTLQEYNTLTAGVGINIR
ncbi:hypothetical protein QQ020_10555 [Fulvivirgaceae bacterium BMA12]|uniref:Uncharacterized protein n=1 Tax=Agaribacillus aureus TaxID=3051825 RepID=A0ABT8L439_9BACT|nr:hypothetical protein [Fulvivirgaceae bacterium BMA12]